MNRRDFVKYGVSSLVTTPLILGGQYPLYADSYASPIVNVLDTLATKLTFKEGKILNSDGVIVDKVLTYDIINARVAKMVDTAVLKITNKSTIGAAWESLFPKGHPNMNTKIGIKLNFSYGDYRNDIENDWAKIYCPFGPKAAVSNAIVNGLCQMLDGNFPIENITLVERMYSSGTRKYYPLIQGYRPVIENSDGLFKDTREGAYGMHWIYATNPLELPSDAPSFIAAPEYPENYRAPQRIYSAYYKNDFLINYAIAKDHRAAGITGAMKNNYGCTDNPMGTHGNEWKDVNSPYAGTRLCIPVFYKNVNSHAPYILNILDALSVVYSGGPLSGKVYKADAIAVSKDPVALDSYLLKLINKGRVEKGLSAIQTIDGRTIEDHPNASFLRISSENHELGSMSLDNILSYDLSSDTEEYEIPTLQKSHSMIGEVRRTADAYQVRIYLDKSRRNHTIESRVENIRGQVVRADKTVTTTSSHTTLEWDHRNDSNVSVKEGVYTWYITVDGILHIGTINDFYTA